MHNNNKRIRKECLIINMNVTCRTEKPNKKHAHAFLFQNLGLLTMFNGRGMF